MTKLETDGKKTSVIPETTPGSDKGNVIFLKRWKRFAPKSFAASNNDLSILAKELSICKIIKGIKLYTIPKTTAKSVYNNFVGSSPKNARI